MCVYVHIFNKLCGQLFHVFCSYHCLWLLPVLSFGFSCLIWSSAWFHQINNYFLSISKSLVWTESLTSESLSESYTCVLLHTQHVQHLLTVQSLAAWAAVVPATAGHETFISRRLGVRGSHVDSNSRWYCRPAEKKEKPLSTHQLIFLLFTLTASSVLHSYLIHCEPPSYLYCRLQIGERCDFLTSAVSCERHQSHDMTTEVDTVYFVSSFNLHFVLFSYLTIWHISYEMSFTDILKNNTLWMYMYKHILHMVPKQRQCKSVHFVWAARLCSV